ncbi:MAG: penicillin-binding protein 1B [Gammaproteobacteria bacterium]|nr:penicillin-binding protein 1B [Gammaproteobacteria bacterium]
MSSESSPKRPPFFSNFRRWFDRGWRSPVVVYVLLMVLLAGIGYVAWLDHTVRSQFEGNRWALPAQVYARPLELFPGATVSSSQFAEELQMLGYRQSGERRSGSYVRHGDEFQVVTRPFTFGDGKENSVAVRAVFSGDRLAVLQRLETGKPVDLVRFDPVLIGKIYPAHNEDRVFVRLKEVPPLLIKGLLAVEDRNFYQHHGIDPIAVARALWVDVRAREMVQGGSTLTQQLVKNFFLSNERTMTRKLKEAVMSWQLEWHYEKDEILEAYCNEIYLGQSGKHAIHGFGRASWFYFRRPLSDLQLPELALLIGLVRGPSYYDPRRHPERALARRNQVLAMLAEQGGITLAQARVAQEAPLGVAAKAASSAALSPAFIDLVRRQLRRDYREEDLNSAGLQIFTTLDPLVQTGTMRALQTRVEQLEKQQRLPRGSLEGAAIVTGSEGGEVLALAGGRDADFAGFNRVLDARRPIGSLVKPAVYLTALANPKYTLFTPLNDGPLTLKNPGGKPWQPLNYDKQFHGWVPLKSALAHSYNLATVRLGMDVGVGNVLKTMEKLGVEEKLKPYPSVLLGAAELTPFEVTQMYQSVASGGFHTPLRAIREVLSRDGRPLKRYEVTVRQAADPAAVFLLTRAMQDVMRNGTGASLYSRVPWSWAVAGKTGTTDGLRDSWFAGFTGDRLAVVWLGRDDNRPTGLSGSTGALQAWGDIMLRAGAQPLKLETPKGIEWVWVDANSGLRSAEGCMDAVQMPFLHGSAPLQMAPCSEIPGGSVGETIDNAVDKAVDWLNEVFQ